MICSDRNSCQRSMNTIHFGMPMQICPHCVRFLSSIMVVKFRWCFPIWLQSQGMLLHAWYTGTATDQKWAKCLPSECQGLAEPSLKTASYAWRCGVRWGSSSALTTPSKEDSRRASWRVRWRQWGRWRIETCGKSEEGNLFSHEWLSTGTFSLSFRVSF